MMDLRQFLDALEREGELKQVSAPVDPKHELGAICKILNERPGSPAVLFENVKGSKIPVVGQLLFGDKRVAMALGLSRENLYEETVRRAANAIPPRLVPKGACQEVVMEGSEVDLTKLPICTNNPGDGAPYITAGHVIIKDPEYGMNMGIYRMMFKNKEHTSELQSHSFISYAVFCLKKK